MSEKLIWWRVWFDARPEPVEIHRFTESYVWIDGRREAIAGGNRAMFPTYAEAVQHLRNKARHRVELAQAEWDRAKCQLAKANALPDTPPVKEGGER
jgi:hypothetical protein